MSIFINMKYIINETKLFKVILKWLRKEHSNLKQEVMGDNIVFLDGESIILMFRKRGKELFVSGDIHSVLRDFFKLNEKQLDRLIKTWLYQDYKLFATKVTFFK